MRRLLLLVLALLVLGGAFATGLYVAWIVRPVQPVGLQPSGLKVAEKEEYIRMVADTYAVDGDLRVARERLSRLNAGNPRQWIVDLAQEAANNGRGDQARRLARLAFALDAEGPVIRELAALATGTPDPTVTPPVTPTPLPTLTVTPLPPESEGGRFDWIVAERRRLTCDEDPRDGLLLAVRVEDADGDPVAGVPLRVEWGDESERFFTGLQSDNPGYADLDMTADRYIVAVDEGQSELALDLTTDELQAQCTGVDGEDPVYHGWFVRFRRTSP